MPWRTAQPPPRPVKTRQGKYEQAVAMFNGTRHFSLQARRLSLGVWHLHQLESRNRLPLARDETSPFTAGPYRVQTIALTKLHPCQSERILREWIIGRVVSIASSRAMASDSFGSGLRITAASVRNSASPFSTAVRPYNHVTVGPHAGTRLGPKKFTVPIGEGRMFQVFLARDITLSRELNGFEKRLPLTSKDLEYS
jgi:hypothetical protein